jgi:hypothetical protein
MNRTKILRYIILAIALIASHISGKIAWDDDGITFAESLDYAGIMNDLLTLLDEVEEGAVMAVEFTVDDALLKHGDRVELQGELSFTGRKGDMIILRKTDGRWVEIGKYLEWSE